MIVFIFILEIPSPRLERVLFFDESNLVSNYFVLESIKSQPKIIAKAIREEKILFH